MTGKIAEHCSAGRPPGIYWRKYLIEIQENGLRNTKSVHIYVRIM